MIPKDQYFKVVKPESTLLLNVDWTEKVLEAIARGDQGPLHPAIRQSDGYLVKRTEGVGYSSLTIPDPATLWSHYREDEIVRPYLSVVEATSAQLYRINLGNVPVPQKFSLHFDELLDRAWMYLLKGEGSIRSICPPGRDVVPQLLRKTQPGVIHLDSLAHGDLHPGNVLVSEGANIAIDLENLRPAPAYCDLIYSAIWARHEPDVWWASINRFRAVFARDLNENDAAFAIAIMLIQGQETGNAREVDIVDGIHWLSHEIDGRWRGGRPASGELSKPSVAKG